MKLHGVLLLVHLSVVVGVQRPDPAALLLEEEVVTVLHLREEIESNNQSIDQPFHLPAAPGLGKSSGISAGPETLFKSGILFNFVSKIAN